MGKLPAIRIGHLRILDHLILGFAGDESGATLLKHTSHPVTAVSMGSWDQIKHALCDGELHGAFLPAPEAMNLFDSGIEIKILLFDGRSGASVVGNRSAGINKLSDFKKKTVLISNYLSVHHLLFYRLMASIGLKAGLENDSHADVYIEVVPPMIVPEMVKYDQYGDIGGCFIEEPIGSWIIKEGWGKQICPSARLWPAHPGSVLVMHDYVIKDYRHHLMDVIHLLVASSQFIFRESNDLHRLSHNFFDQDTEVVDQMFSSFLPEMPISLMPDIQSLEIINKFMVKEMGIMEHLVNIEDMVDTSFALEAGA